MWTTAERRIRCEFCGRQSAGLEITRPTVISHLLLNLWPLFLKKKTKKIYIYIVYMENNVCVCVSKWSICEIKRKSRNKSNLARRSTDLRSLEKQRAVYFSHALLLTQSICYKKWPQSFGKKTVALSAFGSINLFQCPSLQIHCKQLQRKGSPHSHR